MSFLISKDAAAQLKSFSVQSPSKLDELIDILKNIEPLSFKDRPDVRLIKESDFEIYILKNKNIRMFFSYSSEDLVLLMVELSNSNNFHQYFNKT